jgi:hypothetical protein
MTNETDYPSPSCPPNTQTHGDHPRRHSNTQKKGGEQKKKKKEEEKRSKQ